MLGHRIIAAAAVALALAFTTSTAQAAPVLLTPDTNFVTHGNTFVITGANDFNLSVDTTKGDFMAVDFGNGFNAATGTLTAMGSCDLSLSLGEQSVHATNVSVRLTDSMVGKDLFALYRVDASTISGYKVGSLVALDGLVFNIDANGAGQIKGDLAPVVPEPATLSLVLLGLTGLAGAARKKLV